MKILLDPGHGLNTPGKRSPDGQFLEAIYNREIAKRIVAKLQNKGYDAELLVPEEEDISLNERVRRTNEHCQTLGKSNVILLSIHVNAAGNGSQWMNATGWSCYTCKGQTESDRLADCLYKAAEQILENQVIRTDYARDGDPDWEENFYILRHSLCPAVLVEQFFMDNKKNLAYLISDEGKRNLIDVIVSGLESFCSLSFPFHEH
ncbi:MAG: N-acetylmuramoyl-L-alanine amidase [Bacteroidales bacterium]|nr:N-acetylmuramoyl-L-alanine amidase [Bacteroidales bacterium]